MWLSVPPPTAAVVAQVDLGGVGDGGAGQEADDGAVALRRGGVDGEGGRRDCLPVEPPLR